MLRVSNYSGIEVVGAPSASGTRRRLEIRCPRSGALDGAFDGAGASLAADSVLPRSGRNQSLGIDVVAVLWCVPVPPHWDVYAVRTRTPGARTTRPPGPPPKERPPIGTALGLLAVCLLVAATAFFVAAELALVAVDRNKVNARVAAGDKRARIVQGLLKKMSFHLAGAQLGITVASLLLGFMAEPVIAHLLDPILDGFLPHGASLWVSVTVALLLATYFEMVLGELVPKTFAIADPVKVAFALGPWMRAYGLVFGPIISVLNRLANWLVRRVGIEPREELSHVRSLS